MNDPVATHALRYATETTKVFLMAKYTRLYPHLFGHARLESRPATPRDYYVPPSLAPKCIVVTRTVFDQTACERLSCFPFKEQWVACTEHDPPQWLLVGDRFELACQPACRDHTLHTEWARDQCVLANPLKKMIASMPEKLFERASRHVFHGGLSVVEGTLKLNQRYCDAYGLDFVDEDCVASGGQQFGEWLLGKTPIRAIRTAHIQRRNDAPPPLPAYLTYPKKRTKRSLQEDAGGEPANKRVYQEISLDLVKELGQEVTELAIERFLRKKAPQLWLKSMDKLSAKLVLKHVVTSSLKEIGTASLKTLGKAFGVVTTLYALYDAVVSLLDQFDIYDYEQVLDKKTVDKLDENLDYTYFEDNRVRPEISPEYLWHYGVLGEDESDQLEYMIARVEEYLEALHSAPPSQETQTSVPSHLNLFEWKEEKEPWNKTLFLTLMLVGILCVGIWIEYIDVWAMGLFFFKLYYQI